jgi:hypothetical protein
LLRAPGERDGTGNPPFGGERRSVRNLLIGIRNVLLWSYDRGSWQYDVLCLLIVATIFLVPGSYFGDRDRELISDDTAIGPGTGTSRKGLEKKAIEIMIGADELKGFVQAGNLQPDGVKDPGEAILAFVENRCKCKASLILPYAMTRDGEGKVVYKVWYRKRDAL